ncbi:unnamed protein product [Symbiodinium microadriaticum]|nr:unnamed protein product [Symbiodinium microadriaticum]
MDGDRLQAVLARCRRIRGGAETLSNLPPQLAERLKSLYAKCERLKQAKEKTDTPESGSPALAVEESGSEGEEGVELEDIVDTAEASVPTKSDEALLGRDGWDGLAENVDRQPEQDDSTATFDPYLLEAADGEEDAEEVEEDSATEASVWEDCDWTDLPVGTTFDADGAASYSVARKLGQSQGIITYAVNCKGENYVAKLAANGPEAAARRNSGEAADANVVLQNVSVDVFDVSSFVKTLAEVMADFGVSQLAAPAPAAAAKRAAPASQPGPAMLVPTEAAPQPETATFKRLFHEPGKPEEPSPEKVKTLFGEAADVQPKRQMSLDKSCFKEASEQSSSMKPGQAELAELLEGRGTGERGADLRTGSATGFVRAQGSSPERSPPVGQEPASEVWYKAPPPKKTLSSMLSSYEEEEPLEPEAELRVRLTSDAARVRAAQRRGRAEVRPVLEEAPSIEDPAAGAAASETGGLLPGSVWDPATGQFVSEPIPDDILQSFKKEKDLKLEDYQERVLMAQLAEKKRRLEYQKEEAERRVRMKKIEEERAKQQELLRQQQPPQPQSHRPPHDSVLGALLAYETAEALGAAAQKTEEEQTPELSPPANPESPPPGPDQPEMQAASVPVDVQMVPGTSTQLPEADQAQLLNVQLQAQHLQVQQLQLQQLQAQQLATLQSLLNLYSRMSSPLAAGPAIPLDPQQLAMQQQMQLAAQIHAWMSSGHAPPAL